MGKSRRGGREFTREQKLVNENKRLKREISSLRKQLARVDLDRYENIKEMIEERRQEDRVESAQDLLDSLKRQWACKECGKGHLEIILFNKINDTFYYRKCTDCPHRTQSQRYSPQVKGIVKNST